MKKFALLVYAIVSFTLLNAQDTTLTEYVGTYTFPEGGPVTTVVKARKRLTDGKFISWFFNFRKGLKRYIQSCSL
jgi:hypothetical protein